VLAIALAGCRSIQTLKQRCVSGDLSACESACAKGVAGEGGCFHAGDGHRQKAGLDLSSPESRRATEYFAKSCDGRYGDGCLFSAQMIEAPYAPGDVDGKSGSLPKLMPDDAIARRESRLSQACEHGSAGGCKRLGDVLIGKNAARARAAYEKACRAGADADSCVSARAHEVDLAERWRLSCTHDVADDCTLLGNLLYAVDPPRAVRLFVAECQLRGVETLVGGVESFVRDRIREAKRGIPAPDSTSRSAAGSPATIVISSPTVKGQVGILDVERALQLHEPDLGRCMASLPKDFTGKIGARLIVDATGDVFRATVSDAPPDVASCLEPALEELSVSPPVSGTAEAEVSFRLGQEPSSAPPAGSQPR